MAQSILKGRKRKEERKEGRKRKEERKEGRKRKEERKEGSTGTTVPKAPSEDASIFTNQTPHHSAPLRAPQKLTPKSPLQSAGMASPLRYPGGKTRAVKILSDHLHAAYGDVRELISPFMGGGSFELDMHAKGVVIQANDLFAPLYTFWRTVQSQRVELLDAVRALRPMTKEKFMEYRAAISSGAVSDNLTIAAYYFAINRSSFSGATFCGGYSTQAAAQRFTDSSIAKLAALDLSRVTFHNHDCLTFLTMFPPLPGRVVYLDPPYYITSYIYGKDGDLHSAFDHAALAAVLKTRGDWMLSYNDCEYIRGLYADCRIEKVSWSYGMDNGKKGSSEVLIFPQLRT